LKLNLSEFRCVFSLFLILFSTNASSQRSSWYFPEYKHYFRPDTTCYQTIVESIWGWQYLKISVFDNCRYVEISCYRSKDSTLKQKGLYYNTNTVITHPVTVRQAGTDSVRTEESTQTLFKRTGVWKFYNTAGHLIKTIKYKKPDG